MRKTVLVVTFVFLAMAFAFAQTVDTTATRDSSQVLTTASSTGVKKAVTETRPSKPPTNWSKVKDLFL